VAVEAHAMNLAREHCAALGTVVDTALRRSWDYEVTIDGTCWHIEVKGTTGDHGEVLMTPNEVAHARTYPFVALFIVSNIKVDSGQGEEPPPRAVRRPSFIRGASTTDSCNRSGTSTVSLIRLVDLHKRPRWDEPQPLVDRLRLGSAEALRCERGSTVTVRTDEDSSSWSAS
jgi:hypothetical protein